MLLRRTIFKNLNPKAVCNNIAMRARGYHGFIIQDNKEFEFEFRPAILENTLAEDWQMMLAKSTKLQV